jgi:glutamine amidotransferase
MAGLVEETGRRNGIENPVQMTVATCDGSSMWAFRYSTEHRSRSLYYSTDAAGLRILHPASEIFQKFAQDSRLIVSEPLSDLSEVYVEIPESSYITVRHGDHETHPFVPQPA